MWQFFFFFSDFFLSATLCCVFCYTIGRWLTIFAYLLKVPSFWSKTPKLTKTSYDTPINFKSSCLHYCPSSVLISNVDLHVFFWEQTGTMISFPSTRPRQRHKQLMQSYNDYDQVIFLSFPILVVPFLTREGIYFFHHTKEKILPFFRRTYYLPIYYYQYNDASFGITMLVGFSLVPSVTLQVWFFPFGAGRAFSTSLYVSIVFSASSVESCIDPGLDSPARSSLGFKPLMCCLFSRLQRIGWICRMNSVSLTNWSVLHVQDWKYLSFSSLRQWIQIRLLILFQWLFMQQ